MFETEGDEIGFLAHFARLEDPRQSAKTLYPLDEVLLVSLCAVICGADSWVEVSTFGRMKLDFLRRFLPFEHGVPSHDTFGDVFAALDPEAFRDCFVAWTASLARHIEGVVAIDGKTLRRSFDRANGQAAIHMVSAWSSSQHLVLGQEKVAEKSNEITPIPKLLDLLSLKGAIVTIDAMGCQAAIAEKILAKGADYVLAMKGNHGNLHKDIALLFEEQVVRGFADLLSIASSSRGRPSSRRLVRPLPNSCSRIDGVRSLIGLSVAKVFKAKRPSPPEKGHAGTPGGPQGRTERAAR